MAKPLEKWTKAELIARVRQLEGDDAAEPEAAPTPEQQERAQRNEEIVAALFRGLSEPLVAKTYGLGVRHVRTILAQWRAANPGPRVRGAEDALPLIDEALEQLQGAAEELALIASTTKNDNARVGAVRARIDAISRRTALLQAVGILPHDLGRLRLDIDVRYVAETIVAIFEQEGVPAETQARVLDVLTGAASRN